MKAPKLSIIGVGPHMPEWRALWDIAASKWPGKKLGLVGRSDAGDFYFQERGNAEPFIITKAEVTQ